MSIYINSNNQQSGPFEESVVLDRLRTGSLSPNDMAIRHGDAAWQRLGDMFPGVGTGPSAAMPPGFGQQSYDPANVASVAATKKGGGCLKAGLIGTGLLLLLLGIATAAGSRFIPSTSCDLAESDAQKIGKLRRDLDKARSDGKFERIGPLQMELDEELAGAETSQKYCNDDKFRNNVIGVAGGVVSVVGLLMAVIGLFVGRRK